MIEMEMDMLLINITSLVVLVLSFFLFRKAAGSMSFWKLNMISFIFYVFLFLMCFIGAVLVVNEIDNHYLVQKLQHRESRFYGWLAVMYTMIAVPLGMLVAKYLFTFRPVSKVLADYRNKKIDALVSFKDSYIRYSLYALCAISIISIIYTVYFTANIPIVGLLKGMDTNILSQQRISSGRSFGGNEYFKNIFGVGLTPILAMISLSYYKMTRSSADKAWFLCMLFFTILILVYDLQKAPLIMFILGIVMLNVMTQVKLKKGLIMRYMFISVMLLITAYAFLAENITSDMFLSYNLGIFGRVFLSGIAGLFHSFDLFPQHIDFLEFTTISSFVSDFFGIGNQERSARLIMETINPHGVEGGTAGVINSLFIGEAWANFGMVGAVLSPLYVGFVIGALYYFFLLTKKTPIFLGLYGFFSYKATIMGGINDYLYNAGVMIILTVIICIILAGKKAFYYKNPQRQLS